MADSSPPASWQIVEHTRRRCVWGIPLFSGQLAYMRVDRTNYFNERRFVVIVDAERFYQLWRHSEGSRCPQKEDMRKDCKFSHAEEGFAAGQRSPVPLAEVSAYERSGKPGVYFTNGITRTLWLLANGAKAFPVHVYYSEGANFLHQHAGCGTPVSSVEQLLDVVFYE